MLAALAPTLDAQVLFKARHLKRWQRRHDTTHTKIRKIRCVDVKAVLAHGCP